MLKSKIYLPIILCATIPYHAVLAADDSTSFKFEKAKSSAKVTENGGKSKLTVTVSMLLSSSGYSAVLSKSNKAGIPETRFLELKLTAPRGLKDARITPITATYEEQDFKGGVNTVNIEEPSHKQTMDLNIETP